MMVMARMEIFMEFKAMYLGRTVVDYTVDRTVDVGEFCQDKLGIDCQDFVTPFGVDESGLPREFPIPHVDLRPEYTGLELDVSAISLGLGQTGMLPHLD